MKPATKEEFDAILAAHPLAVPDGFRIVGGLTQSRWIENGKEIARDSWDSQGHLYNVTENGAG
jgi:hypothetical protein